MKQRFARAEMTKPTAAHSLQLSPEPDRSTVQPSFAQILITVDFPRFLYTLKIDGMYFHICANFVQLEIGHPFEIPAPSS